MIVALGIAVVLLLACQAIGVWLILRKIEVAEWRPEWRPEWNDWAPAESAATAPAYPETASWPPGVTTFN